MAYQVPLLQACPRSDGRKISGGLNRMMNPVPTHGKIHWFTTLGDALREGFFVDSRTTDGYIVTKRTSGGWVLGIVELTPYKYARKRKEV